MSFQSTHPRGMRRVLHRHCSSDLVISIHASTRDATTAASMLDWPLSISIHASTRDATLFSSVITLLL